MPTKHCSFANCTSDSRYKQVGVKFVPFIKPKIDKKKCLHWIHLSRRTDLTLEKIKRHTYVCTKHFINSNGPTKENPNPLPATVSKIPKDRSKKQKCEDTYFVDTSRVGKNSPINNQEAQLKINTAFECINYNKLKEANNQMLINDPLEDRSMKQKCVEDFSFDICKRPKYTYSVYKSHVGKNSTINIQEAQLKINKASEGINHNKLEDANNQMYIIDPLEDRSKKQKCIEDLSIDICKRPKYTYSVYKSHVRKDSTINNQEAQLKINKASEGINHNKLEDANNQMYIIDPLEDRSKKQKCVEDLSSDICKRPKYTYSVYKSRVGKDSTINNHEAQLKINIASECINHNKLKDTNNQMLIINPLTQIVTTSGPSTIVYVCDAETQTEEDIEVKRLKKYIECLESKLQKVGNSIDSSGNNKQFEFVTVIKQEDFDT